MAILRGLAAALAWLGRQGTRAVAASVFIGLAAPSLAAYVKPHLSVTVFVLLLFSYLRTDPAALRHHIRKPRLAIITALWTMLALPLLFGTIYAVSGLRNGMPALYTIMVLHLAIAPITSSAAFAGLMGLDTAFSLAGLILSNAISPITTVLFSYLFLGASLISPIELGVKLFVFYAASGGAAYIIRRIAGDEPIARQQQTIDGLNVIAVFVFAIAAMDGVPRFVMASPLAAAGLFALVSVIALLVIALSLLVFMRLGIDRALVIGLLGAFRNIGLVMATIGASLPDIAWVYFSFAQFPIYLLPLLLKPLARRLAAAH